MITLLMDGLIAAVKLIDRGLTAVEKNVRLRWNSPLPVVDAQPAGADASAASGPGGHPEHETTTQVDCGRLTEKLGTPFLHEPTGQMRVPDPTIRITPKGLAELHKRLGGSGQLPMVAEVGA